MLENGLIDVVRHCDATFITNGRGETVDADGSATFCVGHSMRTVELYAVACEDQGLSYAEETQRTGVHGSGVDESFVRGCAVFMFKSLWC